MKYLPDLSESTSENENFIPNHGVNSNYAPSNSKYKQRRQYHSTEYLENGNSNKLYRPESSLNRSNHTGTSDYNLKRDHERSVERLHRNVLPGRNGRSSSETRHLPPIGPTKPAREFDRRRALSK